MSSLKDKQPPYGNPQLNIRIEKEILEQIKDAAKKEGMTAQEWARRAILSALGQDVPGSVGRSELEAAIASLRSELLAEIEKK